MKMKIHKQEILLSDKESAVNLLFIKRASLPFLIFQLKGVEVVGKCANNFEVIALQWTCGNVQRGHIFLLMYD